MRCDIFTLVAAESGNVLTASQKFEDEARRWRETGEVGWSGRNEYAYTKLRFWLSSEGALADRVSEGLWEYAETAEGRLIAMKPRWWFDTFMKTRDYCSACGETFHLGNMSFCTHCDTLLGYCHQLSGGKAANGNHQCPRCNVGEMVWGENGPLSVGLNAQLWKKVK